MELQPATDQDNVICSLWIFVTSALADQLSRVIWRHRRVRDPNSSRLTFRRYETNIHMQPN